MQTVKRSANFETTPFGFRDGALIDRNYREFSRIAGVQYSDEFGWEIISNKCTFLQLNLNDNRKYNEANKFKKEGWLPLRYYNFQLALAKTNDNLLEAMEYAKKRFFMENDPIYLPDILPQVDGQEISYGKILKDISAADKEKTEMMPVKAREIKEVFKELSEFNVI